MERHGYCSSEETISGLHRLDVLYTPMVCTRCSSASSLDTFRTKREGNRAERTDVRPRIEFSLEITSNNEKEIAAAKGWRARFLSKGTLESD